MNRRSAPVVLAMITFILLTGCAAPASTVVQATAVPPSPTATSIAELYGPPKAPIAESDTHAAWEADGFFGVPEQRSMLSMPLTPVPVAPVEEVAEAESESAFPPVVRLAGDGPWMPGTLILQTDRLDFYAGKGSFSAEQIEELSVRVEWALNVMEQRFGERLQTRVSLGYYYSGPKGVRGMAYTDAHRAELFYRSSESIDRAVATTTHELAHHLQAQRYGVDIQRHADTILIEGAATWISGDQWLPMCGASSWVERARQIRDSGVPLKLLTAERYGANTAYELWASFVDYILWRYGQDTWMPLYSSGTGRALGSANYEAVFGKSLEELSDEWRAWINSDQ